jgi:MoaA/NifB/PqqE/SkfB family radical SAM enzyme
MCHVWQNPTDPGDEVSLNTLKKIPSGVCYLNLTGGEPTLRKDLMEIVDALYPKAETLEISSNGLLSERLEPVIQKYPDVKIRFSLEGCEETNNRIRGERNGYRKKIEGLFKLRKLGAKDIGIATVIQDDNVEELVNLFHFTKKHGFEFATSTLHNGFQFHKNDNIPSDRLRLAKHTEELVTEMLKGYSIKSWFRAYLNVGLIAKMLGQGRILQCTAATDFVFIDPRSDVYACNVRPDLKLGNLENQEWDEIWQSPIVGEIRKKVSKCTNNCWMVGSAKTAMRNRKYPRLPGIAPLKWVIYNKLRMIFGGNINFDRYLDYNSIRKDHQGSQRNILMNSNVKRTVLSKDDSGERSSREFTNK